MKTKIILSTLVASVLNLSASSAHHFNYYDSSANILANQASFNNKLENSTFSNPANINNITSKDGFVVNLLGNSLSGSSNIKSFVNDLKDSNTNEDYIDVISNRNGENFHLSESMYTSLGKKSKYFTWSIGSFVSAKSNIIPHNGGVNGIMESEEQLYNGYTFNIGKSLKLNRHNTLELGMGNKIVNAYGYKYNISPTELISNKDNLVDYIRNKYEKHELYYSMDLGITHVYKNNYIILKNAISIMDIGSMNSKNNVLEVPTTVNLGLGFKTNLKHFKTWSYLNHFSFNLDLKDILFNNKIKTLYNGNIILEDEKSWAKRINMNVNYNVVDNSYVGLNMSAGLHQGKPMYALDLTLATLNINLKKYTEQIGPEVGSLEDERYLLNFGIKW